MTRNSKGENLYYKKEKKAMAMIKLLIPINRFQQPKYLFSNRIGHNSRVGPLIHRATLD